MFKAKKAFSGAIGSGLPFEGFEAGYDSPDVVKDNLDKLRPMIMAVKETTETAGWRDYIKPFLEKRGDARKLLEIIRKGEDPKQDAAKIEAFVEFLNYVNSLVRSAESLARMATKDEETKED